MCCASGSSPHIDVGGLTSCSCQLGCPNTGQFPWSGPQLSVNKSMVTFINPLLAFTTFDLKTVGSPHFFMDT